MAFVAAPNIVMTEWRMVLANQKIENRVMVNNLGAPSEADLTAIAVLAWNWWEAELAPLVTTGCQLASVVTTDMGNLNGGQYTYAPDATTFGEVNASALPNEVAFCVTLQTASRGRSARGRFYVAALPLGFRLDDNNLTTAAAENYRAALQTLIDDLDTNGKQATIVSYISNKAPRPGGPVYFPILSAVVKDTILDSQRRRRPGIGT